ncbi:uncharacterized protein LOC120346142 isoform X1 [Styela clava]
MDVSQLFFMNQAPCDFIPERTLNNNYEFSSNMMGAVTDQQQGSCFDDLEEENEKQEKELYLCSELGVFLAQELEELLMQQKNLVNDHTRMLLDLQSYETSKKSFLDLADMDAASELNDTLSTLSCFSPDSELSSELQFIKKRFHQSSSCSGIDSVDKLTNLQSQRHPIRSVIHFLDDLRKNPTLQRSGSVDSLTDIQSIPESTLTSYSTPATKNLQSDLEKLQRSHDSITRLEVQLDSTRAKYRTMMTEYSRKLKEISQSLGNCVERARPYFDSVMKARKAQMETQQAAIRYKRAVNLQKAGRDMVRVAEERLSLSSDKFDTTWQEMLNQATSKVNEASREKDYIHGIHMKAAGIFKAAEDDKNKYQVTLQRNIVKAKPYFEVQQDFQIKLEAITKKLNSLEVKLLEARQFYSDALSSIRQSGDGEGSSIALDSLAERGMGVGAENPYASVLPKPMQDILRQEAATTKTKESKNKSTVAESKTEGVVKSLRYQYNPYDLMYLNDTGSDTGSIRDGGFDGYIQDF